MQILKKRILEAKTPYVSKTSKFLQEATPRDPTRVGILGCGRLGLHLANCLFTYADVSNEDMKVSTRRPETLASLKERGICCFNDNQLLASSVDVLFLCVLPSQLPTVAKDVIGHLKEHTIIYSFLSSVPIQRLRQLIQFSNIIQPEITWQMKNSGAPWNRTLDVNTSLENPEQVEVTCPLASTKHDAVVETNEKWVEMILYAFVNTCNYLDIKREKAVDLLNIVVLGQSPARQYPTKFKADDFTKREDIWPVFNLGAVAANPTPVTRTITTNNDLRQMFIKKYKSTFDKFYYWKGIKQLKVKDGEEKV
ncbi:NADP-dependent oxidoreductase domain-containing protein 1-like isoform X2 [Anneissia japonica]|uniref:NADP-dependent oxidoreductase domain-containing protein 1-like isoform X2 n=1 Tax=Anneissia japonica TaxID=1529436 RepID=UPI0014259915|nr:NADP-dependent oxidoreductase domain-containing protein 1-like isoform X2 [Anneissia japonica]